MRIFIRWIKAITINMIKTRQQRNAQIRGLAIVNTPHWGALGKSARRIKGQIQKARYLIEHDNFIQLKLQREIGLIA